MIGIPHTDIPISIASVVRQQVRVMGSSIYDDTGDFKETIDLLAAHTVTPSAILGRRRGSFRALAGSWRGW